MTPSPHSIVPGTQIGAYRVVKQIGAGGMGEVWLAEHTLLGRRAAIKVLHPMFSVRQDIVARFFNEARAATAIADPGIVQIFDFGHHLDGSAYIVMELLAGESLETRLQRCGRLGIAESLRIIRQVSSSVGAAHASGIVHRDLKPDNVFLVRDPEVVGGERAKVLDFGIAKLAGDPAVKTQTSAVMGTPLYMSPEQCRGAGQVDARSDVYALGCVLFTLIVGRPVFNAEGTGDLIVQHMTEPPPRLSSLGAVPAAVDALVARCLAKSPHDRFPTATALASAIGELLADPQIAALTAPVVVVGGSAATAPASWAATPVGAAPDTTLSGAGGSVVGKKRTSRSAVTLVSALVAGGVGIVAWRLSSGSAAPEPAPTPALVAAAIWTPHAPPPDLRPDRATAQVRAVLLAFSQWKVSHAGAPCPTPADLSVDAMDPWGHSLAITCVDQPSDQIIGVLSTGPDGQPSTADDLASWRMGTAVSSLVDGERWPPVATATASAAPPPSRPSTRAVRAPIRGKPVAVPVATPAVEVAKPAGAPPAAAPTPATPPAQPVVGPDGIIRQR